jgi:acyl dehydratase
MIDRQSIRKIQIEHSSEVEKGRLRFFGKAIGETNPIYSDEQAARVVGYASLPAPPTYTFCLQQDVPHPFSFLESLGVDMSKVLHGEQSFIYHAPICAGDRITLETRISDVYEKKGGALEFIVLDTTCRNQSGALVTEQQTVLVVRNR